MKNSVYVHCFMIVSITMLCMLCGCKEDSVMEEIRIIEEEEEEEEDTLCPGSFTPETFFLTDETIAKFPYDLEGTIDSLYYVDSVGNTFLAVLPENPTLRTGGIYPNTVTCVNDSTKEVSVIGEYQSIGTSIYIEELDLRFTVGYRVRHDIERYGERIFCENGRIYVSSIRDERDPYFILPIPQIVFIINDNNWPNNIIGSSIPEAEVILNGQSFFDVYMSSTGEDKFLIYYNFELGLIGFMDQRDGVLYTLAG